MIKIQYLPFAINWSESTFVANNNKLKDFEKTKQQHKNRTNTMFPSDSGASNDEGCHLLQSIRAHIAVRQERRSKWKKKNVVKTNVFE